MRRAGCWTTSVWSQADALGLDPPLRYRAALAAGRRAPAGVTARHALEEDFALSSTEILDIITSRTRLAMAVRGGVAEHHLGRQLAADPAVQHVEPIDRDGGDFAVTLADRRELLVKCKNASPTRYADGAFRVEVRRPGPPRATPPAGERESVRGWTRTRACCWPTPACSPRRGRARSSWRTSTR